MTTPKMNMNLKLNLDLKAILGVLSKAQAALVGIALVGVFGYTAWLVNGALNVKPGEEAAAPATEKQAKISFDKNTIEALKKLEPVTGDVPAGSLGKDDPFN